MRTLVETQVLVGEPGAYRLVQALPSIQVPATVQAVLAARIDRLPPEEAPAPDRRGDRHGSALPLLQAIAELPERRSTAASPTCRRPSSSTRRASSPSMSTPSSMP